MKKLVASLLVIALLISLAGTVFAKNIFNSNMFVYTEDGKSLNVRSTPEKGDNIIGHLKYGAKVKVKGFEGDWACIKYEDGIAYVQSRFLMWYKPDPRPTPKPTPKPTPRPTEDPEEKRKLAELRSEVEIAPITVQAYATRASGWVNMRLQPSRETRRVETCADGKMLTAFAETTNWYRVEDPETGNQGYIHKDYLRVVPVQPVVVDNTTDIGKLNVNGEFDLQCKIPDGYKLQVISAGSSRIIATLVPEDASRPQMMLTVAFSETYADVDRMNDLTDEQMESLKATFTTMNEVEFSNAQTSAGTKLLVARESGNDEDFVSIFSLYKGYTVEFVLSPNPNAANQTLTQGQIMQCIDFLSNLEFVPVE